jgi:hypothetical protein
MFTKKVVFPEAGGPTISITKDGRKTLPNLPFKLTPYFLFDTAFIFIIKL